jgi:hypothetical protein
MTTVYVICVRPVVDLEAARRERDQVFGRNPFSTRSNFLATFNSQRVVFRELPSRRFCLVGGVILSAQIAPLMSSTRQPMTRGLLELTTDLVAVALASIMRLADVEPCQAAAATQLVENDLVHPWRMDENWTATSGPTTVRAYCCPSISCT